MEAEGSSTSTLRTTGAAPPPSGAFRLEVDSSGIAILTLDCPNAKLNKFSSALIAEFDELFRQLSTRADIQALILASGKPDNFAVGAELEEILKLQTKEQAHKMSRKAQDVLVRIQGSRFPVVAAIHGACLSGGLELALACHYRVASNHEKTVLGLPEVQFGLIPAAGGTQRLPRCVPISAALDMILTGARIRPQKALQLGLIDELVAPEILLEVARSAAMGLASGRIPRLRPKMLSRFAVLLESNPVGRALIFSKAGHEIDARPHGHNPALAGALKAVRAGFSGSPVRGYEEETRCFSELAMTDVCRQLIRLFFAGIAAKNKPLLHLPVADAKPVRRIGLVGGGQMGAGIAAMSAAAGVSVRLTERNEKVAGQALREVNCHCRESIQGTNGSDFLTGQCIDRVSVCTDYSGFKTVDLIIESVFEDLDLKQKVLKEAEAVAHQDCILASNTSCLPIFRMAEATVRPEQFIGMHFFAPACTMPLLELVVTSKTPSWVVATAMAFGRQLGKTCIVVRDGMGLYTTRILTPFINEAARLLEEGASIESIDSAMVQWGFALGPLAMVDEVGINITSKVAKIMGEQYGNRMEVPSAVSWVGADGRLGRKNGRGFYLYRENKKHPDRTVYKLLPYGAPRRRFPIEEIQQRLSMLLVNEAVRCLEENTLLGPRDGDVAAVLGLGFPSFRGGPFRYLDSLGAAEAVRTLEELMESHGERFQPAQLLVEAARASRQFYY